jgi:hypothetical protein
MVPPAMSPATAVIPESAVINPRFATFSAGSISSIWCGRMIA